MAAITQIDMAGRDHKLVETIAITNQTANSTTVSKAIAVPVWAGHATVVISGLTLAGTTPLFDFILKGANVAKTNPPDDAALYDLGGWDGITQKTAAAGTVTTIDIGPDVVADDTGSATLSDRYGVSAVLPRFLVYQYTTDGTTDDEDYAGDISVYFSK